MQLSTLQAIRECLKLRSDLKLSLVDSELIKRPLLRTLSDDEDCQIPPIDITHQLTSQEVVKSSEISILVDLCNDQVKNILYRFMHGPARVLKIFCGGWLKHYSEIPLNVTFFVRVQKYILQIYARTSF